MPHKGNIPWNKGKTGIYSEETLEKMKEAAKKRIGPKGPMWGKHHTEETRKKMRLHHCKHQSKESNEKRRIASLGRYHTEETKEKCRLINLGKHPSKETRKKMSIACLVRPSAFRGRYHTEETRKQMELNHYDSSGKNNSNWQGGISFEPYSPEFDEQLKKLIRQRDGYKCQLCGTPENGITLNIHHIDYDKKNSSPDNLISLCKYCHTKTNFNRDFWEKYFNEIEVNEENILNKLNEVKI